MLKKVWVIIPVYNEASVIGAVIENLKSHFERIICVDDASTDNSAELIAGTGVTLVRHKQNMGQGAAIRTGIKEALRNADAEYFVTFDADGQHRVIDAVRLVEAIEDRKHDVVLGSRFLGEAEDISWQKRLFLRLAVVFTNKTTGLHLTDTHNGLRVFNRAFATRLARMRCNGMAHASEVIYKIREGGHSYSELPVTIKYTDYSKAKGQSMLNTFAILRELFAERN